MRKQKGITLVALVVTIIVLLILAGVSISMISGDDGIATQASEAKSKTEAASQEELDKLASVDDYIDDKVAGNTTPSEDTDIENDLNKLKIYGPFWEEHCHLEDQSGFTWSDPFKSMNTQFIEFEYDEDMTWREWIASSYNTQNYKIITTTQAGAGKRGECIVTSTSDNEDGEQLRIGGFEIAYDDPEHTTIATDEEYIYGCGIVYFMADELIDLDETISETLESLKESRDWNIEDKYFKVNPILALTYYDD